MQLFQYHIAYTTNHHCIVTYNCFLAGHQFSIRCINIKITFEQWSEWISIRAYYHVTSKKIWDINNHIQLW